MQSDERTAALMDPVTEEQPTTEMSAVPPALGLGEPDAEDAPIPRPATILDELVARRQAMAREDHELILPIPGYGVEGHELVVRYRYPEGGAQAIAAMEARAVQRGGEAAIVNMQIDYLVACCDEVLLRDDNGGLRSLDPDAPTPLKFGKRLAELFQIEIPEEEKARARFVCRSMFSPGFSHTGRWEGDMVLASQSQRVQGWLTAIHAQTNEDFSGE